MKGKDTTYSTIEHTVWDNGREDWTFWCPGCQCYHAFTTADGGMGDSGSPDVPVWKMTGTPDCPTFAPSLLVRWPGGYGPDHAEKRCHLFLRAGRLQYLSDCTHELAGQTIPLPPFDQVED